MAKAKTTGKRGRAPSAAAMANRTLHWIGADGPTADGVRAALRALPEWQWQQHAPSAAQAPKARSGDVLVLDAKSSELNAYELCRAWVGATGCRTFIVTDAQPKLAEGIAQFCGASGVLPRKPSAAALRRALGAVQPPPALPSTARAKSGRKPQFPSGRMRDVSGAIDEHLVATITDPETNLFNYAFLNYKLDEEYKRAARFGQPLACVLLGFDGECSQRTLRELAGIFLGASRDTDVLGRFDQSSFLFFLPSTGPDGARVMAERVVAQARERKLVDLLGEPLLLSVGVASTPHPRIARREDLFSVARRAFLAAAQKGGGVALGV